MTSQKVASNAFITINSLSKRYRKSSAYALRNVSFALQRGELTAITGANGSGKSTLLGIISSAIKATSGEIYYQGSSLLNSPRTARRITASMPQWYAPIRGVNVREALVSMAMIRGIPASVAKNEATSYMERMRITDYASASSEKLSGGLQRLVSFGMTALQPAELYLFDEPTNDIDTQRRNQVWQFMRQLADYGHSVVVVTHDMRHTTQYVNRFIVMRSGELALEATPEVLAKSASHLVIRFRNGILPDAQSKILSQWKRLDQDELTYYLVPKAHFPQVAALYRDALESNPGLDLEVSPVTFDLVYSDLLYGGGVS